MNNLPTLYEDIIDVVNENFDIHLKYMHKGLCMVEHDNPVSITPDEFLFIGRYIQRHNLQTGYELGTAFGISMLAAGLAMKQTGGQLVTMDAYIEEQYDQCDKYKNIQSTHENSDGYRLANFLVNRFGLNQYVKIEVGWSPNDTYDVLSRHFDLNHRKLDYVFIDAGHWDEAVINDIESVLPFMSNKYVLFLHDVHCFSHKVRDKILHYFGQEWKIALPATSSHYNLAYVTNIAH